MADKQRAVIPIRDFGGLVLTTDPHDRQPGQAADQVNITCVRAGQLDTRGGFRFVSFEDD